MKSDTISPRRPIQQVAEEATPGAVSARGFKEAFKRLQERRPEAYGQPTSRNLVWRRRLLP